MKKYFFVMTAIVCSMFLTMGFTSCGSDNPIIGLGNVEKSDLTGPLFLAFDNTLDASTKKIWAFNETEAVKGTITVVGDDILRVKAEWLFDSWSYSGSKLSLNGENKKSYDLKKVSVLTYSAISFGTSYVCIPSSYKGIDGVNYENDWYSRGLTDQAFWDAFRKSYADGSTVDIKLNSK